MDSSNSSILVAILTTVLPIILSLLLSQVGRIMKIRPMIQTIIFCILLSCFLFGCGDLGFLLLTKHEVDYKYAMPISLGIGVIVFVILIKTGYYKRFHSESIIEIEAQKRHLDGVKIHLGDFRDNFPDYHVMFYSDYPGVEDKAISKEIRLHFRDKRFWRDVNSYQRKLRDAYSIKSELEYEITQKAMQLAPLGDWIDEMLCITEVFVFTVISDSMADVKSIIREYSRYEWDDVAQIQTYGSSIISKGIKSEKEHRELIKTYSKDRRPKLLRDLNIELKALRSPIVAKLNSAIEHDEHIKGHCSYCHGR